MPAGLLASERCGDLARADVEVRGVKYPPEWGSLDSAGLGSVSGWIDPRIWIDPTWAYAVEYRLEFSSGIPLPEPTIGVPLAVGLGGLLAGMPRCRS